MLFSVNTIKEVIIKDVYGLAKLNGITKVLDIGQNEGAFSMLARYRWPQAEVVGVEPHRATRAIAARQLAPYKIHCLPVALGDGTATSIVDTGFAAVNHTGTGGEPIQSFTLADIFTLLNWTPDNQTLVKVDCEGSERFILKDRASRQILDQVHFGIEVHFPCNRHDRHNDYPLWQDWNDYFDKMKKTHNINYGHSSRHNGVGIYTGRLNERWSFEKRTSGCGCDSRKS